MADPLSTAASIAGLVSLAQLIVKDGYGYIRTAKGCPDELSQLVREVTSITGLLSIIENDDIHAFGLSDIRKTLDDILELLSKFRKKILWPLKGDELRDLLSRIGRHKGTLQLALSTETRSQVKEVRADQTKAERERKDEQLTSHRTEVLRLLSAAVDHEARHEDIRDKRENNTGSWIFETEQFKLWLDGPDSVLWCYALQLEISAHRGDIELVVRNKINATRAQGARISPELADDIVKALLRKGEGMFLLVSFQIDYIPRQPTPKKKRQALNAVPKDLNATYDLAMERIHRLEDTQRQLAMDTLTWVVFATRPLRFPELQHAVAIEDGDSDVDSEALAESATIVDLCASLVVLDAETHEIRLVHYTVQSYLESLPIMVNVHLKLALSCLNYLSFDNFRRTWSRKLFETEVAADSLFGYAALNWGHHMRLAGETDLPLLERSLQYLNSCNSPVFLAASECHESEEVAEPVRFACYYGLYTVVQKLLQQSDLEVDSRDMLGQTPLFIAAKKGHEAVVKILLEREDVNVNSRDNNCERTPLFIAAAEGHRDVVKILLERDDVDVNLCTEYGVTPVLVTNCGHNAVVKMLLDRSDVDVNCMDVGDQTPLATAADRGHELIVKMLLERDDIDVNSRGYNEASPLFIAAKEGHEAVVKILLERDDVDVNSRNELKETPIIIATRSGQKPMVEMLLARDDVDVNSRDCNEESPLFIAAEEGHEAVVKILLERNDVDVNLYTVHDETPITIAITKGHKAVVQMLLERSDVDINCKNIQDRTPLAIAAS
ncbi:ankyrin repeat-containing domain protein [Trichophaea hybrida]|nr:ankyrin repeat-containing domain protein [Trichophaea hybrida]